MLVRVAAMHRCIAILGQAIRVLYRNISIAIRDMYHDATSGTSRYVNAALQRMYRNTSVHTTTGG